MTSMEDTREGPPRGLDQLTGGEDSNGSRDLESRPWEDWKEEIVERVPDDEDDGASDTSASEDEEHGATIKSFMRSSEQSDINIPEADVLEEYCDSRDLRLLRAGFPGDEKEKNKIWLDDRKGKERKMLIKSRWLTPYQLYQELGNPVSQYFCAKSGDWDFAASLLVRMQRV